jgi:hypothetical protein
MEAAAEASPPGSPARSHLAHFRAAQAELAERRARARPGFMDGWNCASSLKTKEGGKEAGEEASAAASAVWVRLEDIVPHTVLVGAQGFALSDVGLGGVGDCWAMASFAELAGQAPAALDAAFLCTERHASGWYGIRFWEGDAWRTILVDDFLPCKGSEEHMRFTLDAESGLLQAALFSGKPCPAEGRYFVPLFCKAVHGNCWTLLLEKAFARLHGSYGDLEAGSTLEALEAFFPHGAPGFSVEVSSGLLGRSSSGSSSEGAAAPSRSLGQQLAAWLAKGWLASASIAEPAEQSKTVPTDSKETELGNGLVTGHAYSLLRAVQLPASACPGSAAPLTLLCLRNPWGRGEWKGAFSDGDAASWSPLVRSAVGYQPAASAARADDGLFWMTASDFSRVFSRVFFMRPMLLASDGLGPWRKVSGKSCFVQGRALPAGSYTARDLLKFPQFALAVGGSEPVHAVFRIVEGAVSLHRRNDLHALAGLSIFKRRAGSGGSLLSEAEPLSPSTLEFEDCINSSSCMSEEFELSDEVTLLPEQGPFIIIPFFRGDLHALAPDGVSMSSSEEAGRSFTLSVYGKAPLELRYLSGSQEHVRSW